MSFGKTRNIICAVLVCGLLTACGADDDTDQDDYVQGELAGTEIGVSSAVDSVFSLNSCADDGFNPYVTLNADNLLVDQLVYENVFELDNDYNLSSRVITEYESTDGQYWYLTVDTSILMHDGENLTATDVSYSIQRAMQSKKYGSRLRIIYGCSAISENKIAISLSKANEQLPLLLNVPVVKNDSYSSSKPVGTGPYMFVDGESYLKAFDGYVDSENLPVDKIYLKEYTEVVDIITAFEDSYIDMVLNDPSGKSNLGYGGNTERRNYTTTNMHYFGFNMTSKFVSYPTYRYALQLAVDRTYAATTLMQGGAAASALPISPKSPLYNADIAKTVSYDMDAVKTILYNSNVRDHDLDGKLEYMENGIPMEIDIDLIVCSDAAGKGDIAKKFAEDLRELGLTVSVRELSWDQYVAALNAGSYDMYYAEVKLTADFDLSALLTDGGSLNYGSIDDETYGELIGQYLAAKDSNRAECCDAMLTYITSNTPIIPICFERYEVITHRNVISGINPNSGSVFGGISGWTINFEEDE